MSYYLLLLIFKHKIFYDRSYNIAYSENPLKIRFGIPFLCTQDVSKGTLLLPFYHICYVIYMSIIYIIGVNVHEDMRKEMMGKWIALLTCIINLKGNISAI